MDFELSPEQEQLRDNVARLMKDRYGFEARKTYQASPQGWSEGLWRDYAEMGLRGALLKHGASDKQRAELIGAIAAGELKLSFAHMEKQSGFDLNDVGLGAVEDGGGGYVLNGEKSLVGQGDSADRLSVSGRVKGERRDRDGIGLFLVDASAPGVSRRGYPTQDGQRAAEIGFADVRVAPHDVLGSPNGALPAIER